MSRFVQQYGHSTEYGWNPLEKYGTICIAKQSAVQIEVALDGSGVSEKLSQIAERNLEVIYDRFERATGRP